MARLVFTCVLPPPNRDFLDLEKISTNFFFTDYPKDWTSRSMWSFFNKFGLVVDINVPQKISKDGRRFNFVRYKGVCDATDLITKIRSIDVGAVSITINLAKFKRQTTTPSYVPSARKDNPAPPTQQRLPPQPPGFKSNFADVLRHCNAK